MHSVLANGCVEDALCFLEVMFYVMFSIVCHVLQCRGARNSRGDAGQGWREGAFSPTVPHDGRRGNVANKVGQWQRRVVWVPITAVGQYDGMGEK